jgi:WD40 repeat protein
MLVVAAVFVAVAMVSATVALVQRGRAVDSERSAVDALDVAAAAESARLDAEGQAAAAESAALDAEGQAVIAEEAALASAAEEAAAEESARIDRLTRLSARQIDTQPDLAALLALEANRRRDDIGTQAGIQTVLASLRGGGTVLPLQLGSDEQVHFSDDGMVGVTWSWESGTFVWFDARTGEQQGAPFIAGPIWDATVSGDGSVIAYVTAGSPRTTVARRAGDDMTTLLEIDGWPFSLDHSGTTLAIDPTGEPPLVDMQIIDVGSGAARSTFAMPDGSQQFRLDDEGRYAVVWSQTDKDTAHIHVIDADTGEIRDRFDHNGFVNGTTVTADDRVITGFFDGSLLVSTISTPAAAATERRIPAHVGAVDLIKPLPSGMIITWGRDRSIRFWSGETARQDIPPVLDQPGINAIAADSTGLTLRQSSGRMVRLDPFSRTSLPIVETEIKTPGRRFGFVAGSPWWNSSPEDGDQTVLRLSRLDSDEQREIDVRSVHPSGWYGMNFSPDGEWLRTSDADRTSGLIGIWEISGDQRAVVHLAPIWKRLGIELTDPDLWLADGGERLFVVDRAGESWVAVWIDVESDEVVAGPMQFDDFFAPALVLSDNSVVLGGRGPLRVLPPDLVGEPRIIADADGFMAVDQDPTSGLVLLLGFGGEVALFDPGSGETEHLAPVPGRAQEGAFSPTGDRIAITSVAGGVQLYDVATGQQIGEPIISDGFGVGADRTLGGYGVAWSADGRGVWAVSLQGPVRYAVDPDRWRDIACDVAGRELTAEEWRTFVSDTEPQVPVCS